MPGNESPQLFAFEDKLIRVQLDEQGEPWFVAKDVCRVLDIQNTADAVKKSLDSDEWITIDNIYGNPRAGIPHQMTLISESGLYCLIMRSRKPEAKRFRKWVTAEVLPAIRKTGSYRLLAAAEPLQLPPGREQFSFAPEALPEDVRRIGSKARERYLALAMQSARIAGVTDLQMVHALFIDYCRMLTIGGRSVVENAPGYAFDSVRRFADGCCQSAGPNQKMSLNALYAAYESWCEMQDEPEPPVSKNAFMRVLPAASPTVRIHRPREGKARPYYVQGLQLHRQAAYL